MAGIWIGATFGMVLADGVAIGVGALLHTRLPERFLRALAGVLFLMFGLWILFDSALGLRWVAVAVTATVAVAAIGLVIIRRPRKPPAVSGPQSRLESMPESPRARLAIPG
ncbi:hypothetical protein M2272_001983 [Mycobacterium frederiksbergense]|uniref:GDT1 family protein n=1 Tax=Mycolicibacterium frederiksbergense TaxID=117567 RepID=A0ABT6KXA9_9MYCO|nr:hypothetical protein [Mycolicibacterium frederiksbergense]